MAYQFPKCQIVPLPDQQVSFQVDGVERLRWNFNPNYPRPFFFPFNGPAGECLTRMGHPGAPNHDHHRSVWFAHAKIDGEDFWSDNSTARIRQKTWLAYADGEDETIMATRVGWFAGSGRELKEQELVAAIRPVSGSETLLELQSTFTPTGNRVTLEQSNFGFLAVRLAKGIATHWGDGQITSSEEVEGEEMLFGQSAAWMDYSGAVIKREDSGRVAVTEGITYFDHSANPGYPAHWHVRSDGWMGASLCRHEPIVINKAKPLRVRYLLHAHNGAVDPVAAHIVQQTFNANPGFEVFASKRSHHQFEVHRKPASSE